MQSEYFSWQTQEYRHKTKSSDWYWALGIVTLSTVAALIIYGNYLFALVIFLSAFSWALMSTRPPESIKVSVNKRGVRLGQHYYPFTELISFWIDDEEEEDPKIILKTSRTFDPYAIVTLEDTDTEALRDFLLGFLDEEEMDVPWYHKLFE